MITAQRVGDVLEIALQVELTIYQVGEIHAAAQPWLAQPSAWALDLAQVEEIDGAGLQWLLYVQHLLGTEGHALRIQAASDAVRAVIALCPNTGLAVAA